MKKVTMCFVLVLANLATPLFGVYIGRTVPECGSAPECGNFDSPAKTTHNVPRSGWTTVAERKANAKAAQLFFDQCKPGYNSEAELLKQQQTQNKAIYFAMGCFVALVTRKAWHGFRSFLQDFSICRG
jgi:hypothetical protein